MSSAARKGLKTVLLGPIEPISVPYFPIRALLGLGRPIEVEKSLAVTLPLELCP